MRCFTIRQMNTNRSITWSPIVLLATGNNKGYFTSMWHCDMLNLAVPTTGTGSQSCETKSLCCVLVSTMEDVFWSSPICRSEGTWRSGAALRQLAAMSLQRGHHIVMDPSLKFQFQKDSCVDTQDKLVTHYHQHHHPQLCHSSATCLPPSVCVCGGIASQKEERYSGLFTDDGDRC